MHVFIVIYIRLSDYHLYLYLTTNATIFYMIESFG